MSAVSEALVDNGKKVISKISNFDKKHQHSCEAGLPDFAWCNVPKRVEIHQMTIKFAKWPQCIPNGSKIDQTAIK
jgi:hypothetical protein